MNKKNQIKKRVTKRVALTHGDRIKSRLEAIRPNITPGDRREACQQFNYSKSTISKYLAGRLMDTQTALDLLLFFDTKVTQREEKLKTLAI